MAFMVHIIPAALNGAVSACGNFSQLMKSMSKASVPSEIETNKKGTHRAMSSQIHFRVQMQRLSLHGHF